MSVSSFDCGAMRRDLQVLGVLKRIEQLAGSNWSGGSHRVTLRVFNPANGLNKKQKKGGNGLDIFF